MNGSAERPGDPAKTTLEHRVQRLEDQLDVLIEAIEVLARGLEDGPITEPSHKHTERAARRAHEMLLLAKSAPPA